ncbi:MAG: DUF3566 domain-containing protein [Bacteroidetes bacterium]|nr:DUF3566 domain-containing protein [Bacteroidota bacterium]
MVNKFELLHIREAIMKYEIRSVDIWSVGRTIFLISLIIHLILGMGILLIILAVMNVSTDLFDDTEYYDDEMNSFGLPIGLILVVVLSVSASIFYLLLYVAFGAFYNIISGRLGGIEITLKELVVPAKTKLIPKDEDSVDEDSQEE